MMNLISDDNSSNSNDDDIHKHVVSSHCYFGSIPQSPHDTI